MRRLENDGVIVSHIPCGPAGAPDLSPVIRGGVRARGLRARRPRWPRRFRGRLLGNRRPYGDDYTFVV